MKRIAAVLLALTFCLGLTASARADVTYPIAGFFTMLNSGGGVIQNDSEPYASSSPYYGMHTPFDAVVTHFDQSNFVPFQGGFKVGTGAVNTFNFFDGSIPLIAKMDFLSPGSYTFTGESFNVAPNTMGVHMLFDWNGTSNIDAVLQLDPSGTGMSVFPDTHWGGLVTHNDGPWSFASMDDASDADTILGHPMWNGPFAGSNVLMDFFIPEPGSLLLLGTGLAGLFAVVRRRKGM